MSSIFNFFSTDCSIQGPRVRSTDYEDMIMVDPRLEEANIVMFRKTSSQAPLPQSNIFQKETSFLPMEYNGYEDDFYLAYVF